MDPRTVKQKFKVSLRDSRNSATSISRSPGTRLMGEWQALYPDFTRRNSFEVDMVGGDRQRVGEIDYTFAQDWRLYEDFYGAKAILGLQGGLS